jgi:hypothetical protein
MLPVKYGNPSEEIVKEIGSCGCNYGGKDVEGYLMTIN